MLHGAGATFPAPLYKKWIGEYAKVDPGIADRLQGRRQRRGHQAVSRQAVDFGASDAALTRRADRARESRAPRWCPTTAGMVVLAYNLPGLNGPLKLSRSTYVDLLAGRIPKWNDARIQAINPGLKLPNSNIVLVARLDGSGTTFALTNHLNAIGEKWRESGRGVGSVVSWPGNVMLARGNEGVAGRIKISEGSIGYVEYGFAKRLGLPMAHLENKAGRYRRAERRERPGGARREPEEHTGQSADLSARSRGRESYPIVSLTWLLLYDRYPDPARGAALKRFVNWALTDGQSYGDELGYVAVAAGSRRALEGGSQHGAMTTAGQPGRIGSCRRRAPGSCGVSRRRSCRSRSISIGSTRPSGSLRDPLDAPHHREHARRAIRTSSGWWLTRSTSSRWASTGTCSS